MCLCTTGFLPKNNDIEEGGTAIKIDFDRAGRMQRASRDTYRRVYDDEGRYTMPKRPENRLREKGREYFCPMEVTGSFEGTPTKPKYSLKRYFQERLFGKLDAIVESLEEDLNCKIVVRSSGTELDHIETTNCKLTFVRNLFKETGFLCHNPLNLPF